MNINTAMPAACIRRFAISLIFFLAVFGSFHAAQAAPPSDAVQAASATAMKLIRFGADPKIPFDVQAAGALVDYVLAAKPGREAALPNVNKAPGAYYEHDTKIGFAGFVQYSYTSQIPSILTSPSSLRYSLWSTQQGKLQKLPVNWPAAAPSGKPMVVRGMQRDGITPDLNTGIYYEYDLKRTLVLFNHKGRQVLLTISNQADVSEVGKKGFILGSDEDWNYYYSGEPGSARTGLGWVKSYIYDYFSVGVYVENGSTVRSGTFQWIRAGWNGVNFVQTEHIIRGFKRHAVNSKTILESPNLPPPGRISAVYLRLAQLPPVELMEKYAALEQARLNLAVQSGKVDADKSKKPNFANGIPKEQMVDELMLEYWKIALGKPSLLSRQIVLGMN